MPTPRSLSYQFSPNPWLHRPTGVGDFHVSAVRRKSCSRPPVALHPLKDVAGRSCLHSLGRQWLPGSGLGAVFRKLGPRAKVRRAGVAGEVGVPTGLTGQRRRAGWVGAGCSAGWCRVRSPNMSIRPPLRWRRMQDAWSSPGRARARGRFSRSAPKRKIELCSDTW